MADSDSDSKMTSEERRERLKALRDKRREKVRAARAEPASADDDADEGSHPRARARIVAAIRRKRRARRAGGAEDQEQAEGPARGGRPAARRRRGAAAGAGEGGRLEEYPRLREIIAKRRGGGENDAEPASREDQLDRLQKRRQRLSEALTRTEAELQDMQDNPDAVSSPPARGARKKVLRKKAAAKRGATKRKVGRKAAVRKKVAASAAKARAARSKSKN